MNELNDSDLVDQIDRLVEDELDKQQRNQLIVLLEQEPSGWRQCALAFLEAQSWRRSLRAGIAVKPLAAAAVITAPRWSVCRLASLAAALLATFSIGFIAGGSWTDAGQPLAKESTMPHQTDATTGHGGASSVKREPNRPAGVQLVGMVRFQNDNSTPVDVPVLQGPGLDEHWLRNRPMPLSDYDREQLERSGWKIVDQHRRSFTVQQSDGSRITVPFYQFRCQYVGSYVF